MVEGQEHVPGAAHAGRTGAGRATAGATRDVEQVAAAPLPRRKALRLGAAGMALAGFVAPAAACANSGSPDRPAGGAAGPAGMLIPLDQVPVGGVASVTIDRRPAFVARPTHDTVRAFSAICTHQGCTVIDADAVLLCPCHGSHFEPLTGVVLRGPATKPLPALAVHIDGGNVISG